MAMFTVSHSDKKIDELDLQPIAFKLSLEPGWTLDRINYGLKQYRLWLKMVARHPGESIIPHREVDEVWHKHILDTRKYAADCEDIRRQPATGRPFLCNSQIK